MSVMENAWAEFMERLPEVVGKAMAQGDTYTAGEGLAWYALVTGPTGLLSRLKERDWPDALDMVNTGIDGAIEKHGPYSSWGNHEKELWGYMLAFFYFVQSISLAEVNRIDTALNSSIPKALAIEEASSPLRAAIWEYKTELTSIKSKSTETAKKSGGCLGTIMLVSIVTCVLMCFLAIH